MSDESLPQPPDPLEGRPEFLDDAPPEWDELPPVEPPSAGFIVQLFVVPAIIVAVIVGVYLLFGQLASGEQDWRKQLTDLRSDNPHVRWRGALGLAQMLQADATADGERLADNRDVAEELASLLSESIGKASAGEDDLKQQEFLARTLGFIDVDDLTVPALRSALQPGEDSTVRKNALAALATIANRRHEAGGAFDDQPIVDDVIAVTNEPEALLRHVATYTLGLFESPAAAGRLEVLMEHDDAFTRVNAAVGLARQGSAAGLSVFETVLKESQGGSGVPAEAPSADQTPESAQAFEQALMLSNTLTALSELSSQLTVAQKQQLVEQLVPLAEDHPAARIRVDARELILRLER